MSLEKGLSFAQFFRRVNRDTTIDSICGKCYLTAATAKNESDLCKMESLHVCYAETVIKPLKLRTT